MLRAIAVRTALVVVALLVALLVLELIFRAFFPQPLYAEALAPWGTWHEPNASFDHASDGRLEGRLLGGREFLTHISYDSLGIRGPEYEQPKPDRVARVVIVGDSYSDGMEVELPDTVGQVLQRLLAARAANLALPPASVAASRPADAPSGLPAAIWDRLRRQAGVPLLVASFQTTTAGSGARDRFFSGLGIPAVTIENESSESSRLRFPHDGHWTPAGHARAAALVLERIMRDGLLRLGRPVDRVEVVNLSHAAYDACQYVMVFDALGKRFAPDLVLAFDSGSDVNPTSRDLCSLDGAGTLVLRERTYSASERVLRGLRTAVRAHSDFLTWVVDRVDGFRNRGDGVPVPVP